MKNSTAYYFHFLLPFLFICFAEKSYTQTFYEDVAPIIYDHCTHCHRPGDIASDFPLTSYLDVVSYASLIQDYLSLSHPIWPPDSSYHHYSHEDILTQGEKDLINNWISNGTPSGNINNAPPGPIYTNESFIADPDTVLSMSQQFTIPGNDSDHYKLFVIPAGFTQEKYVRALEFRPGTAKNIHHAFIRVDTTSLLAQAEGVSPGYGLEVDSVASFNSSRLLTLYHAGDRVQLFPEGMGYRIPAQADLILEIHFSPQQTSTNDSAWVNVFFVDTNVIQEVHTLTANENNLVEPLFFLNKNQVETMHHSLGICDSWQLLSVSPQMGVLGKSIKVYSVSPPNDTVPLIHIPAWTGKYQYLYYFPDPILVDSNSNLFSEGAFDNTDNNLDNPNNPPLDWIHECSAIDDDFKIYLQLVGSISCFIPVPCFTISGISDAEPVSQSFSLLPNPAQEQSEISFSLLKNSVVSITLYNLEGRKVKVISQNKDFEAGSYSIMLPLHHLPQGVYFCEMKTEETVTVKKIIIQR